MPELPEVETVRRGLAPRVTGQTVTGVTVRQPRLRWPVPEALATQLPGQRIEQVARRAKYLLLATAAGTVIGHLGMSGRLRWLPAATPWQKHDHAEIALSDDTVLRFNDSRRFGALLWTTSPPDQHPLLRHLGPEPFDPSFSGQYLHQHLQGKAAAIKTVLLDQRLVAGIGNIYANEALFAAGLHPLRLAGQLSLAECLRLVAAIQAILDAAITQGGTTLRDFVGGDGKAGYFQQALQVYGRHGLPCGHCGQPISRCRISQRTTYYCPQCQP